MSEGKRYLISRDKYAGNREIILKAIYLYFLSIYFRFTDQSELYRSSLLVLYLVLYLSIKYSQYRTLQDFKLTDVLLMG